jgi:hypothetical protein
MQVTWHILKAAFTYFTFVFATGFALGVIRVLWVLPYVGTRTAELMEMPLMLIAIVLAARWTNRHMLDESESWVRLVVGLSALAITVMVETALAVALRGVSVRDAILNRDPVSGTAYYVVLTIFALLPWLLAKREGRAAHR